MKSSKTYHSDFLKNLIQFQKLAKNRAKEGFLIYTGSQEQQVHSVKLLNYKNAIQSIYPKNEN